MTFADLARKLRAVDLFAITREILRYNEELVISLNQDQLLYLGIRPDGSQVEPAYTIGYAKTKKTPGKGAFVDLYNTGAYYGGMKLELEEKVFSIIDVDNKAEELLEVYGDVLGLTDESLQKLKKVALPLILQRYKELFYAA